MNDDETQSRKAHGPTRFPWSVCLAALAFLMGAGTIQGASTWWKGNLHTHSLWSDGDDYPEMVVAWYQERGYQFLCLSDHNRMLVGQYWVDAITNRGGEEALEKYSKKYGQNRVGTRQHDGRTQ